MHGPLTDDELALVFLQQFDEKGNEFGDANEAVVSEIKSKLLLAELVVHSVSGRVKSRDWFERKMRKNLNRPVQDVVGVRIITHYREDVRRVEAILREILIVDDGTYVDKATMLAPGAFGYRSVQFVGQIPNEGFGSDHTSLANRMHGMSWMGESAGTVEVQIRSILEHAWAEVDHELIYKAERPAPFAVQRKFALTAALLESADTHLDSIREELPAHLCGIRARRMRMMGWVAMCSDWSRLISLRLHSMRRSQRRSTSRAVSPRSIRGRWSMP